MSVSVIIQPSTSNLIGAYIPGTNTFTVDVGIGVSEDPPKLRTVVKFYEVGTANLLRTSETIDYEYTSDQGSNTYRFVIDVSGRVQAYFDNLNLFPTLDTYGGVDDIYSADYVVTFTSLRATATDDTYQPVGSANSGTITCTNSSRPLTETQNMAIYDANSTASNYFLTNKPDAAHVDYSANEWLMVHDADGKYFVNIEYYNPSLLTTRQFYITGTTIGENDTEKLGVIGVGPVNIDAVGTAARFISGVAVPMEANGVTHYKVRVQNTGATEITPERTYYIDNCGIQYRIHFINRLGGIDTLLVKRSKENGFSYQAQTYNTAKHYGNSRLVSGTHTLRSIGANIVAFTMQGLTPEKFEWLKELAISPAISLELDGLYIPLVLKKLDFKPEDEISQSYEMTFEAEYSNRIEGLRN